MKLVQKDASFCTELVRTPEAILEFVAMPTAQRPRRARTHDPRVVDQYAAYLAELITFCQERDYRILPLAHKHEIAFLRHLRENLGKGIPTVLSHIPAINCYHVSNDLQPPESRALWMYARTLRKEHVRVQAKPATTQDVLAMCRVAMLAAVNRATRDVAILLVMFAGGFRPGELRDARFEHVQIGPRGMRLCLPSSKANYNQPREVTVGSAADPAKCPVRALQRWIQLANIHDGYLFRGIDAQDRISNGTRPMHRAAIWKLVGHYAKAIGMTGKVCAYTLRRGFATTASRNGTPIEEIQTQLRHLWRETTELYVDHEPLPYERSITPMVLP